MNWLLPSSLCATIIFIYYAVFVHTHSLRVYGTFEINFLNARHIICHTFRSDRPGWGYYDVMYTHSKCIWSVFAGATPHVTPLAVDRISNWYLSPLRYSGEFSAKSIWILFKQIFATFSKNSEINMMHRIGPTFGHLEHYPLSSVQHCSEWIGIYAAIASRVKWDY